MLRGPPGFPESAVTIALDAGLQRACFSALPVLFRVLRDCLESQPTSLSATWAHLDPSRARRYRRARHGRRGRAAQRPLHGRAPRRGLRGGTLVGLEPGAAP